MLPFLSVLWQSQNVIRALLVLTALSVTTAVRANEIPTYQVEQWCEKVSRSAGSRSEMIYGGCINQEQSAYDTLKKSWAGLPTQTQDWCDKVAKSTGGGTYMILNGCVDQETSARKENSTRRFQR
jgi:hypothetical protein